jgi:hypothetical protein
LLYDKDNVIVCELVKPDTFLTFEFVTFGNEMDYLGEERKDSRMESDLYEITRLLSEGYKYRAIADELGISISKISKLKAKNQEAFENAIKFYESNHVSSSEKQETNTLSLYN